MVKLSRLFIKDRWADGSVMYQIYPRSFQDSNGDGVGDIPGIIERLDYLKDLGVSGIWLSPFYPSPMADFGYDVADYCDVDPVFGTLKDFRRLLREAHKRKIKIMVDIVPNHSSDEHPWFQASKKSRTGRYADWYVWRDAKGFKDGKPVPPNNWVDMFSGDSSWEWVPEREQFYLHSFHKKQPDLDWGNPAVRSAMKNVLRFWLKLGVDGFRVDAVPFLDKDPLLTDNPEDPNYNPDHGHHIYRLQRINSQGWPLQYTYLREMSAVLMEPRFRRRPRFMVTEGYVSREDAIHNYLEYYRAMHHQVAAPFTFEGIERPWGALNWRAFLRDYHTSLSDHHPETIAAYAFGNHDQSRLASRLGSERARSVAVLQLTLPGMTFIYNGEELGMHDVEIPASKIQDPGAIGGGGRDPERTPMQWSADHAAGFTTGEPWLPLARDYKEDNVETEKADPGSFLNLYRHLIHLRTKSKAFSHGSLTVLSDTNPEVLAYSRTEGKERYIVAINFEDARNDFHFGGPGRIVISSLSPLRDQPGTRRESMRLKPHEAVVIKLL